MKQDKTTTGTRPHKRALELKEQKRKKEGGFKGVNGGTK